MEVLEDAKSYGGPLGMVEMWQYLQRNNQRDRTLRNPQVQCRVEFSLGWVRHGSCSEDP